MASLTRVAVVTGANKGIGYAIVKNLAPQFKGVVYLTARNEELGKKALSDITNLGISNVKYHQLDITDSTSIDRFAKFIKDTHGGLDVLINNAAILIYPEDPRTEAQKAAETIRVNFTSTVNFSHAMFPLLRPHARVVNVASMMGLLSYLKNQQLADKLSSPDATEKDVVDVMDLYVKSVQDGTYESHGFPKSSYGPYVVSKIGLIGVTRVHQRLLSKDSRPDILINVCCPGYVDTDMSQHKGFLTVDQGSETPIFLALTPENADGPRGEFYSEKKKADWFSQPIYPI